MPSSCGWSLGHKACTCCCFAHAAAADEPSPLAARMQQFVDQQTLSGAVTLVAQHGKIVSQQAVGLADIDSNRAMRSDTIFWFASMTKPITATAVMLLQDE